MGQLRTRSDGSYDVTAGWLLILPALLWSFGWPLAAQTIQFSGYDWRVKSGRGGPGPNLWDSKNVWLDASGNMHLKIAFRDGKWSCAEVWITNRLGFGRYQFQVSGPIDALDDNVVLGLFNYPTADVGPDATHEIDIEFARWGKASNPIGNFTVWPVEKTLQQLTKSFGFMLETDQPTTHRFTWNQNRILFQLLRGHRDDDQNEFASWTYEPADHLRRISQQPMPVHINLWLFKGLPPKNGKEIEVVVKQFIFKSDP